MVLNPMQVLCTHLYGEKAFETRIYPSHVLCSRSVNKGAEILRLFIHDEERRVDVGGDVAKDAKTNLFYRSLPKEAVRPSLPEQKLIFPTALGGGTLG